ncbi:hypothetical protein [Variovorax sp. WDL1]|uniref:hypothetical protein n=1 Tax=Variovorax sp. WDL1 TaxID=207745 RepID=UPI001E2948DC|nr:hypothetical protein [Variovorax sp. WDL1]
MKVSGAPGGVWQMRFMHRRLVRARRHAIQTGDENFLADFGLIKEKEMATAKTWAKAFARINSWTHENFRIQALPCLEGGPIR